MSRPDGPPYGWCALPDEVRGRLLSFANHAGSVMAGDLLGLYVCGSLGRGCYHPATSDVDLLLVSEKAARDGALRGLAAYHGLHGTQMHAVGITREQGGRNEVPTPADFELQSAGPGGLHVRRPARGRGDLLLVRQDAYDCNTTLLGRPVREVLPPVPWEALQASADQLLPYIVPHFKNPALMLCRLCYASAHHSLCSKVAAGEWAMQTFDAQWQDTIRAALSSYHDGIPDNAGETPELRAFEAYCGRFIAQARAVRPTEGRAC